MNRVVVVSQEAEVNAEMATKSETTRSLIAAWSAAVAAINLVAELVTKSSRPPDM